MTSVKVNPGMEMKETKVEVFSVANGAPNYVNHGGPAYRQPGINAVGQPGVKPVRGVDATSRKKMLFFLIIVGILSLILKGYLGYRWVKSIIETYDAYASATGVTRE